jgi:hypothetical protein
MPEHEGLSIYAKCGEFGMPAADWRRLLWVARVYGWRPLGTCPPDSDAIDAGIWPADHEWDGTYFPAYGQHIVESDAVAIALALERALPDIPDGTPPVSKVSDACVSEWFADVPAPCVNALEALKGIRKDMVRAFIIHCRERGGVWLY